MQGFLYSQPADHADNSVSRPDWGCGIKPDVRFRQVLTFIRGILFKGSFPAKRERKYFWFALTSQRKAWLT